MTAKNMGHKLQTKADTQQKHRQTNNRKTDRQQKDKQTTGRQTLRDQHLKIE